MINLNYNNNKNILEWKACGTITVFDYYNAFKNTEIYCNKTENINILEIEENAILNISKSDIHKIVDYANNFIDKFKNVYHVSITKTAIYTAKTVIIKKQIRNIKYHTQNFALRESAINWFEVNNFDKLININISNNIFHCAFNNVIDKENIVNTLKKISKYTEIRDVNILWEVNNAKIEIDITDISYIVKQFKKYLSHFNSINMASVITDSWLSVLFTVFKLDFSSNNIVLEEFNKSAQATRWLKRDCSLYS